MTQRSIAMFDRPAQQWAGVGVPIRYRGGTFLGLLVGVLLGLAGALAVALYVNKVPVPFVDKMISRKASDDAAEAERNRRWNPNAGLGGKEIKSTASQNTDTAEDKPSKPAPESVVSDAATPAADAKNGKKGTDSNNPTDAPTAAQTGKVYSTNRDPLADLVAAKTQQDKVPPVVADPFTYFVQVGAFRSQEDAQAQRAKLALMGLDARVSEREQSGRMVYRVRLGPYERQSDAEKMKEDLLPAGLETALVRVQR